MPYKTISVKLLPPTKVKKDYLDNAFERYSLSFEYILRELRQRKEEISNGSKSEFLKLIDSDLMSKVDVYDVQPFKDALKMDVSMLLSTYAGRVKSGIQSSYPMSRTCDEDIDWLVNENASLKTVNNIFDKYNSTRPILFSRFSASRDYSILEDPETGKYYVKLYLFNLKNATLNSNEHNKLLRYITTGDYIAHSRAKKRYIILPLDCGEWQKMHFLQVKQGKAVPKSAILLKKGEEYFLNFRLWYESAETIEGKTFLGVARGVDCELFYYVCDDSGSQLHCGRINSDNTNGINRLHKLASGIVSNALKYSSKIIMANLSTRSDGLNQDDWIARISPSEYKKLTELISYKAELAGLPKPVLVSSSGIFHRCPSCETFKHSNRMNKNMFLCTTCGFSMPLEQVGALNLARALISYINNKLIVYYQREDNIIKFDCKALDMSFSCKDDQFALDKFYNYFGEYMGSQPDIITKKQMSIFRKITSHGNIKSHISFVERGNN